MSHDARCRDRMFALTRTTRVSTGTRRLRQTCSPTKDWIINAIMPVSRSITPHFEDLSFDDEYFATLTAEDFARIDAITALKVSAEPTVHVEVEAKADRNLEPPPVEPGPPHSSSLLKLSPKQRFRSKKKAFSVTDLVSPSW
jgi:hypothetical protein